jgi:hypothetical protein
MNIDDDQEGVMDSLLEALKTGSAFSRDQRRKRDRPPRAVGGNFSLFTFTYLIKIRKTVELVLARTKDT